MNQISKIEPASLVSILAQVLPSLGAAYKNKKNPAFKSSYADLSAVLTAIAPIAEHGLWFRQVPVQIEGGIGIETFYVHESGAELSAGITPVPVNKNDAQGLGSAMTYGRRYGLQTAFGLSSEDDDGNAAVAGGQSSKSAVSPPQPELISHDDATKVISLCTALGGTVQADLLAAYKVASVPELPASATAAVLKRLDDKMAERAKAGTNNLAQELADEIPY